METFRDEIQISSLFLAPGHFHYYFIDNRVMMFQRRACYLVKMLESSFYLVADECII